MVEENLSEEKGNLATDRVSENVEFDHQKKAVGENDSINNAIRLADQLLDVLG